MRNYDVIYLFQGFPFFAGDPKLGKHHLLKGNVAIILKWARENLKHIAMYTNYCEKLLVQAVYAQR